MSIAGEIIDFYDDANRDCLKKTASPGWTGGVPFEVLSPSERDELPNDMFGLVVITKTAEVVRKYPLADASHVWLAGQYLSINGEKLAMPMRIVAARHIKLAAAGYPEEIPLPDDVVEAADLYPVGFEGNVIVEDRLPAWNVATMDKTAAPLMSDEAYALVYQTGDGETIRKYAMPDEGATREAMAWFEKYANQIDPEQRPRMARAITKRASAFGIDVGGFEELPTLYKYAASGWNPSVMAHLEQRKALLPRDEASVDVLDKLASAVGEANPTDFARVLDAFDTKAGLRRYYGRGIEDAYASSLGTDKVAMGWSDEVDGETITEGDLKKAAASPSFAKFFGSNVKEAFQKDPVGIFESLPTPNKAIIAQIARGEV